MKNGDVSYVNLTDCSFSNSNMPLFDLQSVPADILADMKVRVEFWLKNVTVREVIFGQPLRLFSVQDIQYPEVAMTIEDSLFERNDF
jgi:hypothetical protein